MKLKNQERSTIYNCVNQVPFVAVVPPRLLGQGRCLVDVLFFWDISSPVTGKHF